MKRNSLIKQLMSQGSYTIVNKPLMKKIGLDCTYMFQYLLDLQDNCFEGEFFQQQERIAEEFGWTVYKVQTVIKQLVGYGLMNVVKKGLPAKNYYSINHEQVVVILNDLTQILSSENIEDKSAGIDIHNIPENTLPSDVDSKAQVLSLPHDIEHTNFKHTKKQNKKEQNNINNNNIISAENVTGSFPPPEMTDEVFDKLFPEYKSKVVSQ
jgi:hypothetical protein